MITVLDLRQHLLTAADDLHLPLSQRDVDRLTTHIAHRTLAATAPRRRLAPKRLDALLGLALGETAEETGRRLCVAPDTVKSRRRLLYQDLGVSCAAEAVAKAYELGILQLPGDVS